MAKFQRGQSGNPGGRPEEPRGRSGAGEVLHKSRDRDACRDHAERETPPAARVSAASAILDRGYGKPPRAYADASEGLLTLEDLIHASYRV